MTLLEALKQLFGSNLDQEIEPAAVEVKQEEKKETTKTEEVKKEPVKTEPVKENPTDPKSEAKVEEVKEDDIEMIFEDGWFNSETGKVDLTKIKNPEVLAAIQQLENKYTQEKNSRLIDDKLNDELKNYSLAVSQDTLRKVINLNDVKITKDGVSGVKEAIEALKSSEPGFFKNKEQEDNPLNQGFNPVEKRNTDNVNSFAQAFQLMEEITN